MLFSEASAGTASLVARKYSQIRTTYGGWAAGGWAYLGVGVEEGAEEGVEAVLDLLHAPRVDAVELGAEALADGLVLCGGLPALLAELRT